MPDLSPTFPRILSFDGKFRDVTTICPLCGKRVLSFVVEREGPFAVAREGVETKLFLTVSFDDAKRIADRCALAGEPTDYWCGTCPREENPSLPINEGDAA